MCGIAGIIWKNKTPINKELFRSAADLMKHRGRDHTGYYTDDMIDLVHHRLSILDLEPRFYQSFSIINNKFLFIMEKFIIIEKL